MEELSKDGFTFQVVYRVCAIFCRWLLCASETQLTDVMQEKEYWGAVQVKLNSQGMKTSNISDRAPGAVEWTGEGLGIRLTAQWNGCRLLEMELD
jgi:hypothetical protein